MVKESNRWMETSDGILMFPSLVWKARIEARLHDSLAGRILAALTQMRRDLLPLEAGRGWPCGVNGHTRDTGDLCISTGMRRR